jgi:hypothetical protein
MVYSLNIEGNIPKTYFPTPWLSSSLHLSLNVIEGLKKADLGHPETSSDLLSTGPPGQRWRWWSP